MARVRTTVRLEVATRAALERLAQQETRSLSGMIEALVKAEAIRRGTYTPAPLKTVRKT